MQSNQLIPIVDSTVEQLVAEQVQSLKGELTEEVMGLEDTLPQLLLSRLLRFPDILEVRLLEEGHLAVAMRNEPVLMEFGHPSIYCRVTHDVSAP